MAFIETYLKVPKGKGALKPVKLRDWQKDIIAGLFDEPRPRQGLLSLPRGNGKTALAAFLAAYALFADGEEGARVLCVASDERQAGLVFAAVRRMVELNPVLAEQVQVFRDRIYLPATDSELRPLPAEPGALQGYDPSLVVVDELHVVTEPVWDAMALASGKRDRSLVLAISTPGVSPDSVMWRLVQHGREDDDDAFYFREYAAPEGCDLGDEEAWAVANPALDDFLARDALRATLKTTREAPFRRYRLGQWAGSVGGWIEWSAWADRATDSIDSVGERVVLGFDGSASGDSTALVGCTLPTGNGSAHLFVLGVWANPGSTTWRVPRAAVDQAVADAFRPLRRRRVGLRPVGLAVGDRSLVGPLARPSRRVQHRRLAADGPGDRPPVHGGGRAGHHPRRRRAPGRSHRALHRQEHAARRCRGERQKNEHQKDRRRYRGHHRR
ncbi:MAG: Phage terminase, large subunit [Frankiales bacterium]|nr:Phage terminase, large subunit [Frankiales bacterium]